MCVLLVRGLSDGTAARDILGDFNAGVAQEPKELQQAARDFGPVVTRTSRIQKENNARWRLSVSITMCLRKPFVLTPS
jgi:hypothetical protein